VHSKVDYCNSLYYNFKSQMTRLHQIQNSLTRAVITAPKSCHTTPCLRCLQCLRITERIENTKFWQPPNFHICVTWSLFNLAALALHLLSLLLVYLHHLITNNWSFLLIFFTLFLESAPCFSPSTSSGHPSLFISDSLTYSYTCRVSIILSIYHSHLP